MNATRITNVTITPVAFRDPPLLNAVGVHEPFAIRSILEVESSDGVTGLGESYGDAAHLDRLRVAAEALRDTLITRMQARLRGWLVRARQRRARGEQPKHGAM